jgi:hypothetical protein
VIDRTREHARELGGAHPPLERRDLAHGLGRRRRVALRLSELEEDVGVVDVACELLERRDLPLERGALAGDDLRLLLIVPEPRLEGLLLELRDLGLQLREVKGAPLAP